jgi:hypothetical protein
MLYAMHVDGNHSKSAFRKSAKTVGSVMGNYHPHGDCLAGNTRFYSLDGSTPTIESLVKNEIKELEVLVRTSKGKVISAKAHSFRIGQHTKVTYKIHLSDGAVIEATKNHPFYVRGKGWVKTYKLDKGDFLAGGSIGGSKYLSFRAFGKSPEMLHKIVAKGIQGNGEVIHHQNEDIFVTKVEKITHDDAVPMYDFTVDKHHNAMIVSSNADEGYRLIAAHNSSIYGAMVTLTQLTTPLVKGEGNWGSFNTEAAAMRYTEAKLAPFTMLYLFLVLHSCYLVG